MTPVAAALFPVTRRTDYTVTLATRKYWWQNGAHLDQGQTGTCVGNAFAHRRADSPVPVTGIDEAWAQKLYVDASGDTTLEQGTSGLAACRVLATRGTISQYHWVTTPEEMQNTILTLGPVCIGIDWFNSMFYPNAKYSNMYIPVDYTSGLAGGHEVVINGINLHPTDGPPFYRLKNSWGTSWGKGGSARIAMSLVHDLLFARGGDAVIITENAA